MNTNEENQVIDVYRRQWAVLHVNDRFVHDWSVWRLERNNVLYTHPDLTVVNVEGLEGKYSQIIILGIAFFAENSSGSLADSFKEKFYRANGELSKVVIELCGTYVVIGATNASLELYSDPAGMRGVYYNDGRAASTPTLLPNAVRDTELDRCFPLNQTNEWYPGDICPYKGTRALLSNHSLTLETGEIERFWPISVPDLRSIEDSIVEIADIMRAMVGAVIRRWSIVCSITGGKDSRVSVAACRDFIEHVKFFTVRSSRTEACDIEYPARLAEQFDLNHRFLDVSTPSAELLNAYNALTAGMSIGERARILNACEQLAGPGVVHLNGNLGAITKRFYWHTERPTTVRKSSLLREFYYKPPVVREAINRWFDSLPDVSACMAYNLMYLEQRGGRWMGIGETGSQLFYDSLSLFNNRRVFELVCSRQNSSISRTPLLEHLVREMWPELLSIPYCPSTRRWSKMLPLPIRKPMRAVWLSSAMNSIRVRLQDADQR